MESERQKQEENSTNSVGAVQTSNATEIESTEDGDSTPENEIPQMSEPPGEKQKAKAIEPEKDCVIDVERDVGSSSGVGSESFRAEKVCRICHLSADNSSENSELIQLGCGCKEELGSSHLHCAETWFKHKGNRYISFPLCFDANYIS